MSFFEQLIQIFEMLFCLYFKIQDSREVIKYNSGNDKRQEIIDELRNEIKDVRKEINAVGERLPKKNIDDNSKYPEKLIDYLLDIPSYLSDDLSVITCGSTNGLPEYDSEKSFVALLKAQQWIKVNMRED